MLHEDIHISGLGNTLIRPLRPHEKSQILNSLEIFIRLGITEYGLDRETEKLERLLEHCILSL